MGAQWYRVDDATYRMRVDGGWIYKNLDGGALVFVPDPPKEGAK